MCVKDIGHEVFKLSLFNHDKRLKWKGATGVKPLKISRMGKNLKNKDKPGPIFSPPCYSGLPLLSNNKGRSH